MKKLTNIILGLVWMCVIIPLAVTLTLHFKPLYYTDVVALDISGTSGLPVSEIKANYDELIRYNTFTGPKELHFPTLAMSETGRIHFEEVKTVFLRFQIAGLCALAAGLILTPIVRKMGEIEYLKWTGILTIVLPLAVGGLVAISWQRFFVLFHKVLFNNDYWIFSADTDPVITILPDTFFMHALIMILVLSFGGALICLIRYRGLKKQAKIREQEIIIEEYITASEGPSEGQ